MVHSGQQVSSMSWLGGDWLLIRVAVTHIATD
jgi:hypothetical protein